MSQKKTMVEDALIQMRKLEETLQENAKGILASTMKEEISELVKESLNEVDEEEVMEQDVPTDSDEFEFNAEDQEITPDDEADVDMDVDMDTDEVDMETDMDMGDEEEAPLDLTGASDEELLKVFKAMGETDNIIVKKDGDMISLKDDSEDVEYLIQLGESEEEEVIEQDIKSFNDDEDIESFMDDDEMTDDSEDEDIDDVDFSFDFDDEEEEVFKPMRKSHKIRKMKYDEEMREEDEMTDDSEKQKDIDDILDRVFSETATEEGEVDEIVYEIEMDEETDFDEEITDEEEMDDVDLEEAFKAKVFKGKNPESKKSKGTSSMKTLMKKPTGKAFGMTPKVGKKVEAKEGDDFMNKEETKEAARTLGMGKAFGKKGLPKPKAAPRHLKVEGIDIEAMESQLQSLREKNEEYRKALNIFREKLNEVAVFNSNLAYATRLFTEHSTSKQEKINILRRFDGIETLKESKSLYSTIREELNSKTTTPIKESIENKIDKTPSSGSAANLIESKTYENPQFLRMKDLMSKIK
jgi:hypothetical protein